ncbi:succinyl-diaminopimelate desuccinylase [Salinisphaera sp.]|uniref:succinyl-diaminopimelate desuccinylase n=1 Tax=Salinisphaera sp. TaxID=1914330 RepID=UPI002D7A21FA|nr:succinyl-diaminopimelate desuccinylase [Salinisphaera sp.]HET7314749.1 succinyl-diaminopimelate desuccinylase [Salinisphaera sp.]
MSESPALDLARALIRRPSVTPEDAGCQDLIAERLARAGFAIERLRFGPVDNLWAVAGDSGPLLCLAGHTDVVPAGPAEQWTRDPFAAEIADGRLYGRGAADMKSSVAALVVAAERFRTAHPDHPGRLAFLLTSDEEGPAVDGTQAVMSWLAERGERIDFCLLGEPSSTTQLADTIKNGRRGSLNACIRVRGRQGHVAYPQRADNALHRLIGLLNDLTAHRWDDGDAFFPPTSFQVSHLHAGTGAENIIPGEAEAVFNWRFSPLQSVESIQSVVHDYCDCHGVDAGAIEWRLSGRPFITTEGALIDAARRAIRRHCGYDTTLSTAGGTSDGRFIAPTGAEVIELGPLNASIHQLDEHIEAAHVDRLAGIYETLIGTLIGELLID